MRSRKNNAARLLSRRFRPQGPGAGRLGLRQSERLRDGHLRDSGQRHCLRHAVGTRLRAEDRELLLGEHPEWNYTCETFATFSTACRGQGQRRRRRQGRRPCGSGSVIGVSARCRG